MRNGKSQIFITLLALVLVGCSKHLPKATATHPEVYDLGVVEVADGVPIRRDLGDDRVCIITPAIESDGNVLLSMKMETSGKLMQSWRAKTKPGLAFQMTVDDLSIAMNPRIKP